MENRLAVLKKLNTELPHDSAIPKRIQMKYSKKYTCTQMVLATLFTIAERRNKPNIHQQMTDKQKCGVSIHTLWTECLHLPKIHMLTPYSPV